MDASSIATRSPTSAWLYCKGQAEAKKSGICTRKDKHFDQAQTWAGLAGVRSHLGKMCDRKNNGIQKQTLLLNERKTQLTGILELDRIFSLLNAKIIAASA